ncbi:MAG TPA: DNA-processing protein DprA [Candidatus Paceibacterota bacterium]
MLNNLINNKRKNESDIKIIYKNDLDFPPLLREINDLPEKLYVKGNIKKLLEMSQENSEGKILCVVGARKYSNYGKEAIEQLISGLKGYNICIVSGLALGIDSIAHRAALEAGLYTVSFPGSGLDSSVLYPTMHSRLAEEIVEAGGALLSEFELLQRGADWTFPKRNRLMAGISHAVLVVEAELKSGTLITSKYAVDYNRDVGAIPGQIFSPLSAGPHMLIRLGATPITCADDILELLGFERKDSIKNGVDKDGINRDKNDKQNTLDLDNLRFRNLGENEKKILKSLHIESKNKDALARELNIDARLVNTLISSLELEGFVKEEMGVVRRV